MSRNIDLARLCVRALSRPVYTALARGEDPAQTLRFLQASRLASRRDTTINVLSKAFEWLRTSYRTEYVYKTAIANRIVFGRHSPKTSSLAVELHVGRSIVDAAVFNGTSTAYEVKTELDTPRRLATQTPDYLRAFDHVYIVTHPDLADRYASMCDERVGIMALDNRESLRTIRNSQSNAASIENRFLFRMLRRTEYVPALEKLSGKPIDLPNGLISSYCEALFCELPSDVAHRVFLEAMRARSVEESQFYSQLPPYLRVLGYSTPLSNKQRTTVLRTLDSSLAFAN